MGRIFLTGLSGAGKSTVGRVTARMLGWRFIDTDDLIAQRMGRPVGQALREVGETHFRQLEAEALAEAASEPEAVIATGGGAVIAEQNRILMRQSGLVVYLQTSVEAAWQRLSRPGRHAEGAAMRPLVAGPDGQQKLAGLYETRQRWYEEAELRLNTDNQTPDALARYIIAGAIAHGALLSPDTPTEAFTLDLGHSTAQAVVEWGGLHHLPQRLQELGFKRRAFIVTDSAVGLLYAEPLKKLLEKADLEAHVFSIPAGEASKTLASFQTIIDWLVEQRAERQEPLIALGGGVVGDLVGFVAACYQRGVPLIQIPTTLLAQVDAAIGGKTAVNHPLGKNLIGAYYQPRLTLADPACLLTLPERAYREGWAEIIKYGVALDTALFDLLETSPTIQPHDSALLTRVVAWCIRLKLEIVRNDEREQGQRAILNYGHTFGHALEAITDYTTWLHGEAVAVGMEVAALIAQERGLLSSKDVARQQRLLLAYGLPIACPEIDVDAALERMSRDKKVRNGAMRWILPTNIGQSGIYDAVPLSQAREAIASVAQRQVRLEETPGRQPISSASGISSHEQTNASVGNED
ncbi:MAG TPA: 3-dehydroquinate synthase [Ktedonobacterales bacterium]|nr:3-dehydroquinate synthase [Ktedonobacterales bacterium]